MYHSATPLWAFPRLVGIAVSFLQSMATIPASGPTADGSTLSPAAAVASALADGKKHLLLAASGSVAAIKLPLIAAAFARVPNLSIRIILTPHAARFLAGQAAEQPPVASLHALPNVDAVYVGDADEWDPPWTRGAPILHIELRRWADVLVVAPLSANLLAKIANGLCDSLLTCVIRAWQTDPAAGKRILVAPSMNTCMWNHPLTARQLATLRNAWGAEAAVPAALAVPAEGDGSSVLEGSDGSSLAGHGTGWYEILLPQSKSLACGDIGLGAMCDWKDVVLAIQERLALPPDTISVEAN
ncbi:Flavoprotein [Niveomyces insectorum RCEF 264]|uniref:Flavoprotein n=1 Tax=Niveomyces insectorum RCEF 264 TaxID=1081102 RepID=A0A167RC62_9HYPO|nr:Flavoprotein [Niveomyces insectorum RCEF 264]